MVATVAGVDYVQKGRLGTTHHVSTQTPDYEYDCIHLLKNNPFLISALRRSVRRRTICSTSGGSMQPQSDSECPVRGILGLPARPISHQMQHLSILHLACAVKALSSPPPTKCLVCDTDISLGDPAVYLAKLRKIRSLLATTCTINIS